jgi:hypothetical protein
MTEETESTIQERTDCVIAVLDSLLSELKRGGQVTQFTSYKRMPYEKVCSTDGIRAAFKDNGERSLDLHVTYWVDPVQVKE